MNKRITSAVAVYFLPSRDDDHILIGRRKNSGYMDGFYQLFAGHVEYDELPKDALIREMEEELGIQLSRSDLMLVHTSARPRHDETGNRIDLYYQARNWIGEPKISDDKCDDLVWVHRKNLPINFVPHVREALKYIERHIMESEFTVEWVKAQPEYASVFANSTLSQARV